jgi:hypothetical protein
MGSDTGYLPETRVFGYLSRFLRESGNLRAGPEAPAPFFCERGLAEISTTS